MRIAIVEDDPLCSEQLKQQLEQFSEEQHLFLQIRCYFSGLEFLEHYQPNWDLILMDIEMPHMNGIATARKLRFLDPSVLLIFITQMAQYAIDGYSVHAIDYILKPVNYYALSLKLLPVIQLIQTSQKNFINISNQDGQVRLSADQIFFIEVLNHTLIYHTGNGDITASGMKSLKNLESELITCNFVRCHQSYLVHLKYVTHYTKNQITVGLQNLPISRSYYKPFTQALLEYWGTHSL